MQRPCTSLTLLTVTILMHPYVCTCFAILATQVTEEYEKGAQSFKDAGQDFDAERLREQAAETVKVGA